MSVYPTGLAHRATKLAALDRRTYPRTETAAGRPGAGLAMTARMNSLSNLALIVAELADRIEAER